MSYTQEQSKKIFAEAEGYVKTLERSLERKSKFNNELLYQMSAMGFEKLFVALLAYHEINANHHTPLALVEEVEALLPVPKDISDTAHLIGSFESICSVSGFGYKMPNDDELQQIIVGLIDCKAFVGGYIKQ
jgi:hypothetical protein